MKVISYFASFLLFISFKESQGHTEKTTKWTHLVFAQQWPPTVCVQPQHHQECQIPADVSNWVVHGIWPSAKTHIQYCNRSLPFDFNAIKPIESELLVAWPNLFTSEPVDEFWKYEWLKHGTCAVSLPTLGTEFKYFKKAIELHSLYNIEMILKMSGIVPDNTKTYTVEEIQSAIRKQTGKPANLMCINVKGYSSLVLLNVEICMDKDFSTIDCPNEKSNCFGSIVYLPFKRNEFRYNYLPFMQKVSFTMPDNLFNSFSFICNIFVGMIFLLISVVMVILIIFVRRNNRYSKAKSYNYLLL